MIAPVSERQQRLAKRMRWLRLPARLGRMQWRNLTSRQSLLESDGPVVSLTSYGQRVRWVHLAIESIGQGSVKPSRLALWLESSIVDAGLPDAVQRLVRRGLTIGRCPDWGPHKKYYPEVCTSDADLRPLVTADDDVLYPTDWLESLVAAWREAPSQVHCHRARRMSFDGSGRLLPYRQWPGCRSDEASALNFSVGGSGVLYPWQMRQALQRRGTDFTEVCPQADDIWLNATARREGLLTHQVHSVPRLFDDVPGMRSGGLARSNVKGGGNDRQIAATFAAEELDSLARLARQA